MVAVTVILAGVIAAFVFSMVGGIQSTKIVAVSVKSVNATASVSVMNMGGQDINLLTQINVIGDVAPNGTVANNVGAEKTFALTAGAGQKRITAIGIFSDGTQQVLADTFVTRV